MEMKPDEKFVTKAAKKAKDKWKLRNGLTQNQKVLKGLFGIEWKSFKGLSELHKG